MPFSSDKRLYLTEDKSEVVEEGNPSARFLFVAEGGQVSDEDADRYGLKAPKKSAEPMSELESRKEALNVAGEQGSITEAEVHEREVRRLEAEEEVAKSEGKAANKARHAPAEDKSG
jgi:hypothetical protein